MSSWGEVADNLRTIRDRVGRTPVYHARQSVERGDEITPHLRKIGEGFAGLLGVDLDLKPFIGAAGRVHEDAQQNEVHLRQTIGNDDPAVYLAHALHATGKLGEEGQIMAENITTMNETVSQIRAIANQLGPLVTTYAQAHSAVRAAADAAGVHKQTVVQQIDTYLS